MSDEAAPIAVRGDTLRLRRHVAGGALRWTVEELAAGEIVGATMFGLDEAGAAADQLDLDYLADLEATGDAPALVAALRWGLAHRAGDLPALDALMTPESGLHDHRHTGIGDVPKAQLLALLEPGWDENLSLAASFPAWSVRAVLVEVIYLGGADPHVIDRSASYTVFTVGSDGRITDMDVYDADPDGEAAARTRYDEIAAAGAVS